MRPVPSGQSEIAVVSYALASTNAFHEKAKTSTNRFHEKCTNLDSEEYVIFDDVIDTPNCCAGVVRTFNEGMEGGQLLSDTAQCWEQHGFCVARYALNPNFSPPLVTWNAPP